MWLPLSEGTVFKEAGPVESATCFRLTGKCEVILGHKGGVFVMAGLSVPVWESKLCALLLGFFPPAEANHAPPG